jgi:hypothetical protein
MLASTQMDLDMEMGFRSGQMELFMKESILRMLFKGKAGLFVLMEIIMKEIGLKAQLTGMESLLRIISRIGLPCSKDRLICINSFLKINLQLQK